MRTRTSATDAVGRKRARGTQGELPDAAWKRKLVHELHLASALDEETAEERPQR